MFVHRVTGPIIIGYTLLALFRTGRENRLASADPKINFDCPKCQASLSAASRKAGKPIQCPGCGGRIEVPDPNAGSDWMLSGLEDEAESDIPDTLKIDGISSDSHGRVSWDVTCDVCDSVLLVNLEQVGTKVKCNDCHSLLEVQPPEEQQMLDEIASSSSSDISDAKIDDDFADFPTGPIGESEDGFGADDLMLAPAVDLPSEVTELQTENFFEEFNDSDMGIEETESSPRQPAAPLVPHQSDDDEDEMIEVLDVPPEQLNKAAGIEAAEKEDAFDDDDEAPVRVFAKKRSQKKKNPSPRRLSKSEAEFKFDEATFADVTDKAANVLKSRSVMTWAVVSMLIMAFGSAIWHWLGVAQLDPETTSLPSRMFQWLIGFVCGQGIYFLGYVILLFVGGVIFRETAQGRTEVESVSCNNVADFTSTMLLFGFSMFIAALPWMMAGWMFLTLPLQFLLAGVFLFSAWKNQSPFMIVSDSIFEALSSKQLGRWKNWVWGALVAAVAGFVGGGLMEVSFPILSIFTSVAGSILITLATLFYAAITGWHCGNMIEQ